MEKITTPNKLLECFSAVLHLANLFRNSNNTTARAADFDLDYRQQVLAAFDLMERTAFEQQISVQRVQQAKYAAAAFIDELVLSSAWPGRANWMGKALQLEFFGEHLAGENFFKRLSDIRQNAVENIDVLEIFYICLQLGFEGMYRMRGMEQVMALQVDLRSQIELVRGVVDPRLAEEGLPKTSFTTRVGRNVPYWVIVSVTAAIVFFIFLGYAVAIDRQARQALTQISGSQNALAGELQDISVHMTQGEKP